MDMITVYLHRLWLEDRAQDLIEYALMAALLASTIGVLMPGWVFPQLSRVFSGVTSSMVAATSGS
jgi:Flp pilus assembly pilin Flp